METVEVTTAKDRNRKASREWYHRNREAQKEAMRKLRLQPRTRASLLLGNARKRAEKLKLEFDLDLEWTAERLEKGVCEASGLPFVMTNGRHAFAPSLDRINPKRGYTKDNTQVVVWAYNAAKGIASHDEVMTLARALVNG